MNPVECEPLRLILYGTPACHLCEQAGELLSLCVDQMPGDCQVEYRDIAGDDQLLACYGIRIPVIAEAITGRELGWPFDQNTLLAWLLARRHPVLQTRETLPP